jgi:hypothetical protein
VTELRLHRALYRGTAVDEAAKAFAGRVELDLVEEPDYWVVKLSAGEPERERRAAGELANWALGLTVQKRGR